MTQGEQVVEWEFRREGCFIARAPWFLTSPLRVSVIMDTYYVVVVGSCLNPGRNILWNSNRTNFSDCLLCIHHSVKEAKQFVEERLPAALVAAALIFQNDPDTGIDSNFWRKVGLYEATSPPLICRTQWVLNEAIPKTLFDDYPRPHPY